MSHFDRAMSGGKAISGGALSPRSRRGSTDQANDYWSGGGGLVFTIATGGTTNDYVVGGISYRSHTFTSNGNFVVTQVGTTPTVDAVIVAGGGGGGTDRGAGGGAGGMQTTAPTITATTYSIVVGGGGGYNGGQGGNSSFNGVTSTGGGYGGSYCCGVIGPSNGGSGGGQSAQGGSGGTGIAGQGNNGGNSPGTGWMGSGGGGKGAAGVAGDGSGPAAGGTNDYRTGSNETYSYGGQGRGGAPFDDSNKFTVSAYGSGGAGNSSGQNGYQGVVIIRYRRA
jgi:fibronectin-binding autotransporter adhesin